jgi:hypothetical protein
MLQQRCWNLKHSTGSSRSAAVVAAAGFAGRKARSKARKQPQRKQQQQQRRPPEDTNDSAELLELSQAQHVITVPDFAPELCQQLRQVGADASYKLPQSSPGSAVLL